MEEVTAGVCLVSIKRSRYSAVYGGGHAKTAFLHAAISAAAHQNFISFTNLQFGICYDERSELLAVVHTRVYTAVAEQSMQNTSDFLSKLLPALGKRDVLTVQSENVLIFRPIHYTFRESF